MKGGKKPVLKKRDSLSISLEDKKKLYFEWKNSGLSKSQFCKKKGLGLSSFSQWYEKTSFSKLNCPSEKDPISVSKKNLCEKSVLVEIKLPNGMAFSSSFELPHFILFLKDLSQQLTTTLLHK